MEFRDLKMQYQHLKKVIDSEIQEVLLHCDFISGHKVDLLEKKLSGYVNTKYCITCANGTDALVLALMAWKIGDGDAVFVPDFTFFSSGEAVSLVGATPVFVDVCKKDFNISCDSLEGAIEKTLAEGILTPKVIIAVDLFGLPADFPRIRKIADKYGLLILEDGAQGFGGSLNGKKACSFGDISTTSFFPAKPLGCYGDGGAIFTDDERIAAILRSLRVHGKGTSKYDNIYIGMNSRLDTLQAAILIPKFQAFQQYELDDINKAAEMYTELLADCVCTPKIAEGFYSSWAQYTIQLKSKELRNKLQAYLKKYDIPSIIYYEKPMHNQKAFSSASYKIQCKNTMELCDTVLSLPIHPYMDVKDIELVVKKIKDFIAGEIH